MLEKSKVVKIDDFGTSKYFKIVPLQFDDFFDVTDLLANLAQAFFMGKDGANIKIRDYIPIFLKAVLPMDAQGKQVVWQSGTAFSYDVAKGMFENPMALLELVFEVAKFQQVFFEQYPMFHKLMSEVSGKFDMKMSESKVSSVA